MTLPEIVAKYRSIAGKFGVSVALADFGLSPAETERTFGLLDEDYHISRFVHFTLDRASETLGQEDTTRKIYSINSFPQSHVSIDAGIAAIL